MSNNPLDFPKSKIPVPESPYLSASRSGYLADLSDQVFFDENVPTPVDPITKRPNSPPYSYGPPGILHDPSVAQGPSASPRRKSRRRRPPDITTTEYVDTRLEELLGPSVVLDRDDSVDDILDSIKRRGSRELRDTKMYSDHGRSYVDISRPPPIKKRSPISRSHEAGLSDTLDSLGLPSESESRKERELGKGKLGAGVGRIKDLGSKTSLNRPDSRASDKASSRPPSDKQPPAVTVNIPSPKKSPAKPSLKAKGIEDAKAVVMDTAGKVGTETRKKVQTTMVKADMPSPSKEKLAMAVTAGAVGGATAAAATLKGKIATDPKDKTGAQKESKEKGKENGQKPGAGESATGKGEKDKGKDGANGKKEDPNVTKPAFSGTDIHGHIGIDLSKLDDEKRQEVLKDHSMGMKLLGLCHAADWYGVENQLRYFEKRVQNGAVNYKPLATVKDEV